MSTKSFNEVYEYYTSILKLRLGEISFNYINTEVFDSNYYKYLASKFETKRKMPDQTQFLILSNSENTSKDSLNANTDLLRTFFLIKLFNDLFNSDFLVSDEESMIELLHNLFKEVESKIYKSI